MQRSPSSRPTASRRLAAMAALSGVALGIAAPAIASQAAVAAAAGAGAAEAEAADKTAARLAALRDMGAQSLADAQASLPADAPAPPARAPAFSLTDQDGAEIRLDSLAGRPWLLFFGYIVDTSLCSAALPRIAGAVNMLEDAGLDVTPIIASIDPAHDRPGEMGPALVRWHPRMQGMTGDAAGLEALRDAFGVRLEQAGTLPDGSPIWIHGGLLYLVGPDGRVLAALPPLMEPRRLAEIVAHLL